MWLSKRQEELKRTYGFDQKIVLGNVLVVAGISLLTVGVVVLFWKLVIFIVRRWRTRAGI